MLAGNPVNFVEVDGHVVDDPYGGGSARSEVGQAEATQQAIAEQHQRECVRPGDGGYDVALYESPYCRYLRRQLREANLEWAEITAGSLTRWLVGGLKKYLGACLGGAAQGAIIGLGTGPAGLVAAAAAGCLTNALIEWSKNKGGRWSGVGTGVQYVGYVVTGRAAIAKLLSRKYRSVLGKEKLPTGIYVSLARDIARVLRGRK